MTRSLPGTWYNFSRDKIPWKKALSQILQFMHCTCTCQFPWIQNSKLHKIQFRIYNWEEKAFAMLIEWTFFTDVLIICQIEARQRFLPYQTATNSWPGNQHHNHWIDLLMGQWPPSHHAESTAISYVPVRLAVSENTPEFDSANGILYSFSYSINK